MQPEANVARSATESHSRHGPDLETVTRPVVDRSFSTAFRAVAEGLPQTFKPPDLLNDNRKVLIAAPSIAAPRVQTHRRLKWQLGKCDL